MQIQYAIAIVLFYFFSLVQNSLLAHFAFMGAMPNIVFTLFFLIIFFLDSKSRHLAGDIVFYSFVAGFFLDIFLPIFFGISIILLILLGFAAKKIQQVLKQSGEDGYPFIYFLPLFFIFLSAYYLLSGRIYYFWGWNFVAESACNIIFSSIIFGLYKKFIFPKIHSRQLSLFKNV